MPENSIMFYKTRQTSRNEKKEIITMLHVAMLSKWHVHATEYAGYFNKMDDVADY